MKIWDFYFIDIHRRIICYILFRGYITKNGNKEEQDILL